MSKAKRDLTAEERKLWRRVAASVKSRRALPEDDAHAAHVAAPLRKSETQPRCAPAPKQAPKHAPPQHAPKPAPKAAHRAVVAVPPQNRAADKRVRRGDVEIGATLDLHGYTQDAALAALSRFLQRAQARDDRAVIVVTGVGRGGEGVLKRMFPTWLAAATIRPLISGYAPAHRSHGGAGAFYVFLRHRRGQHG